MKIYGRQVVIGTKKLCVEYTSKIMGAFEDCHVGYHDYKGDILEKDIIFLKDKKGYLVDIRDIAGNGFLELTFFGACPRYKTQPKHAGDEYIDNIKPYLPPYDQDTIYDLKQIISKIKTKYTNQNQSILN